MVIPELEGAHGDLRGRSYMTATSLEFPINRIYRRQSFVFTKAPTLATADLASRQRPANPCSALPRAGSSWQSSIR
jgi:hypothetical protein